MKTIIALTLALTLAIMTAATAFAASNPYNNTYKNTGNQRIDIVEVAKTQLGYTEGHNNKTKYGEWYGMPNAPWCAIFVSWCARQAGVPTSVLKNSSCAGASAKYFNIPYYDGRNYKPKAGDLFFTKSWSHVGLVYRVEGNYFYTLEGNSNNTGSAEGTRVCSNKRYIPNFYFGVPNYNVTAKEPSTVAYTEVNKRYKVIASDGLNLRETPNGTFVIAVPKNTTIQITRLTKNTVAGYTWGYGTYNGKSGWLAIGNSKWATPVNSSNTVKTYTIKSSNGVWAKSGAGTGYSRTGAVAKGSVIRYTQTKQANGYTWLLVEAGSTLTSGSWGTITGKWVPML